jgi:uncharacterized protein YjbI with pentapeptide repeats
MSGYCILPLLLKSMPQIALITAQELIQRRASGETCFAEIRLTEANLSGANLSEIDLSQSSLSLVNFSGANLSHANLQGAKLNVARLGSANLSHVNLSGADLNVANLSLADLNHAVLRQASLIRGELMRTDLSSADLTEANLSEATLREAKLRATNLSRANLSRADLTEACLANANLTQANLSRSSLVRSDMQGADLRGAELRHADFRGGNFSDVNLSGANLRWADFSGAKLCGANLRDAKLSGANLSGVDLSQADLSGATLVHADLSRANLIEVEWQGADLTGAKLTGAKLYGVSRFNLSTEGLVCGWLDLSPGGDHSKVVRFSDEETRRFFNETPPTVNLDIDFELDPESHLALAATYQQIAQQCDILQRSPEIQLDHRRTRLIFRVTNDQQLLPMAAVVALPFQARQVVLDYISKLISNLETQVQDAPELSEIDLIKAHHFALIARRGLDAAKAVEFSKMVTKFVHKSTLFQAPVQVTVSNSSGQSLELYRHAEFGRRTRRFSTGSSKQSDPIDTVPTLMPNLSEMLEFIENC